MLYQTIASVVLLATAANAASAEVKRQPYRLAVMAMPGQSLMRRDTSGYQPDQTKCKDGNNCAEACGASFQQCSGGQPGVAHSFNPAAGQSCCTDNSGSMFCSPRGSPSNTSNNVRTNVSCFSCDANPCL
jgi:hypothetical protein